VSPTPSPPGDRTVHRVGADGEILDWLVSPVWEHPCRELAEVVPVDGEPWDTDGRLGRWRLTNGPDVAPVKALLYRRHPLPSVRHLPPLLEGGPLSWPAPFPGVTGEVTGTWTRHHTPPDGIIERSAFCYTPTYRAFLAATCIEVDQPETRRLRICGTGPLQVWLNDELVLEHTEFGYMQPWTHEVETLLPSGSSRLVIASWNAALREVRQLVAVQVVGLPVRITLPSPGADERRDTDAERLLAALGIRRWETGADSFELHGPPGVRVRLSLNGSPISPVTFDDAGCAVVPFVRRDADSEQASMLGTGEITVEARVDDDACPSRRTLLVGYLPWRTRAQPEGDPSQWRREVLEHTTTRSGSARCLARHALDVEGKQVVVTGAEIVVPLRFIRTRADCADFEALGLMLLWNRVPEDRWEPAARSEVREALLGFKYWIEEPGTDAMCYFTENHQLVWHTVETLVGQAFPEDTFGNCGWTGIGHAEHGAAMAAAWVAHKLRSGFSEFDSNAYLAIDALALVALVDHASDEPLRRAAEALLDKILFTLAANSWRGVHGSAHGRSYTPTLRASCLEETAPIMWLAWGTGALNEAALPAAALATSTAYRLPEVVRAVAMDTDRDWAASQTYYGDYGYERDLLVRPYGSTVLVRRGPGGMVSSVQDYRQGLPGLQEHVWGITLPGQVQVWATNPAAKNHGSHTRPNAWVGHRVLPRVRQHDRTVVALHQREGAGAAVHLWFPVARMDEWERYAGWLLGRKGAGYVAVGCDGGWEPDRAGDEAWQRWVPRGDGTALVALHSDRREYPDLASLRKGLPALTFRRTHGLGVEVEGVDGTRVALDWDGPLLVDGAPVGLVDGVPERPAHLDNPACRVGPDDDVMRVRWGGHRMTLDLRRGLRLEPPSSVATAGVGDPAPAGTAGTGQREDQGHGSAGH
jgi:hypothetical protein